MEHSVNQSRGGDLSTELFSLQPLTISGRGDRNFTSMENSNGVNNRSQSQQQQQRQHSAMCRPKFVPPPLVLPNDDVTNLLTEFAIIATSPRSPLMQKNLPIRKRAYSCSSMETIHSYARLPITPPPGLLSPPQSQASSSSLSSSTEDIDPLASTSFATVASVTSSSSNNSSPPQVVVGRTRSRASSGGTWSHSWPVPVWYCFLKGSHIRFVNNEARPPASVRMHPACAGPLRAERTTPWRRAEELGLQEALTHKTEQGLDQKSPPYASNGIMLTVPYQRVGGSVVCSIRLHFRPVGNVNNLKQTVKSRAKTPWPVKQLQWQRNIEVDCSSDHPFYVQDKGWSSAQPELTIRHYGIPCRTLQVDDICLPPSHPEASFSSDIFECIRNFDFTPEDTSAVLALSNMAKSKQIQNSANNTNTCSMQMSPPASPTKKCTNEPVSKAKRPMNGFMLFAKTHRIEYTQSHPGKDNRAISVLLGETWKKMSVEERMVYADKARVLAEVQKKQFPDCWKRRRSFSNTTS